MSTTTPEGWREVAVKDNDGNLIQIVKTDADGGIKWPGNVPMASGIAPFADGRI